LVISIFFFIFAQDYKYFDILAHILYNNSKVKEIYLTDGEIKNSKYLLMVHEDGYLVMKWCYEDLIEVQPNPSLIKVGRKMVLEYGEPNLFNIKQRIAFQDEQGKLESRWEKIM
jgi:hypothetical protein